MYQLTFKLKTYNYQNFKQINSFFRKKKKKKIYNKKKFTIKKFYNKKIYNKKKFTIKKKLMAIKTIKKQFTVLRSPHVHKKSREYFQYKIYQRQFILLNKELLPLLKFQYLMKNKLTTDFLIQSKLKICL